MPYRVDGLHELKRALLVLVLSTTGACVAINDFFGRQNCSSDTAAARVPAPVGAEEPGKVMGGEMRSDPGTATRSPYDTK